MGGAARARPGTRRVMSSPDRRWPRKTRSWLTHLPLFRALRPGCPGRGPDRPRDLLWALVPARTLTRKGAPCPPQARTLGPVPIRLRRQEPEPGPVAGLRVSREKTRRQRNRVDHRLPESRALRLDASTGAFPPAWLETFAIHPAAGADEVWHAAGEWG